MATGLREHATASVYQYDGQIGGGGGGHHVACVLLVARRIGNDVFACAG